MLSPITSIQGGSEAETIGPMQQQGMRMVPQPHQGPVRKVTMLNAPPGQQLQGLDVTPQASRGDTGNVQHNRVCHQRTCLSPSVRRLLPLILSKKSAPTVQTVMAVVKYKEVEMSSVKVLMCCRPLPCHSVDVPLGQRW